MGRALDSAFEQVVTSTQLGIFDPSGDRFPRLVGQFELDRPLGLLLQNDLMHVLHPPIESASDTRHNWKVAVSEGRTCTADYEKFDQKPH